VMALLDEAMATRCRIRRTSRRHRGSVNCVGFRRRFHSKSRSKSAVASPGNGTECSAWRPVSFDAAENLLAQATAVSFSRGKLDAANDPSQSFRRK